MLQRAMKVAILTKATRTQIALEFATNAALVRRRQCKIYTYGHIALPLSPLLVGSSVRRPLLLTCLPDNLPVY